MVSVEMIASGGVGRRLRRFDLSWTLWLVPLAVAAILQVLQPLYGQGLLVFGIGGGLGLGLTLLAARRPATSLLVLVGFLPFASTVFSLLYKLGVPVSAFSALRSWKEVLAIGVFVAGFRRRQSAAPEVMVRLAWAYVALLSAYLVMPMLAIHGASLPVGDRLVSWRDLSSFVLIFIGAYWCRITATELRRVAAVALMAGLVIAGIGLYEAIDRGGWGRIVVETIEYPAYQNDVNRSEFRARSDGTVTARSKVAGSEIVRIGSIFFSPIAAGFALILPAALALERLLRRGAHGALAVAVVGVALLLTQTRTAILGLLIVMLLAIRPRAGRQRTARVRVALLLVAGTVLVMPLVASSGLSERTSSAIGGTDTSTDVHRERSSDALVDVIQHPLGYGLGTGPGVRASLSGSSEPAENYYLEIGLKAGAVPMLCFVTLVVTVARRLQRAAQAHESLELSGIAGAFTALAVGAMFLHAWSSIPVAWTVWALAGAALGSVAAPSDRAESSRQSNDGWRIGDLPMDVR